MPSKCQACLSAAPLPFEFTMAFQPIVDCTSARIWGYEALVRGPAGEGAGWVLDQVTEATLYKFDQACRVRAIEMAGQMLEADADTRLSINFMPNAVYEPAACIRASLEAARKVGLNKERLTFEFTENERFRDMAHIAGILGEYKRQGFLTAIDDFGAGYSGLSLLASLQPDLIKIDMDLIRGIDRDVVRQTIVAGLLTIARQLDIEVIAEGIETEIEYKVLRAAGIRLFQGYFFAKPAIGTLPAVRGFEASAAGSALRLA